MTTTVAIRGSFDRSLELQTYRLRHAQRPPVVTFSPWGQVAGYLLCGAGDEIVTGREIAANNWDALLALLQYHAHLFNDDNAPRTLFYRLPLNAPTTQWMSMPLKFPIPLNGPPPEEWGAPTA